MVVVLVEDDEESESDVDISGRCSTGLKAPSERPHRAQKMIEGAMFNVQGSHNQGPSGMERQP